MAYDKAIQCYKKLREFLGEDCLTTDCGYAISIIEDYMIDAESDDDDEYCIMVKYKENMESLAKLRQLYQKGFEIIWEDTMSKTLSFEKAMERIENYIKTGEKLDNGWSLFNVYFKSDDINKLIN